VIADNPHMHLRSTVAMLACAAALLSPSGALAARRFRWSENCWMLDG
jgi:hypothetical protein